MEYLTRTSKCINPYIYGIFIMFICRPRSRGIYRIGFEIVLAWRLIVYYTLVLCNRAINTQDSSCLYVSLFELFVRLVMFCWNIRLLVFHDAHSLTQWLMRMILLGCVRKFIVYYILFLCNWVIVFRRPFFFNTCYFTMY